MDGDSFAVEVGDEPGAGDARTGDGVAPAPGLATLGEACGAIK